MALPITSRVTYALAGWILPGRAFRNIRPRPDAGRIPNPGKGARVPERVEVLLAELALSIVAGWALCTAVELRRGEGRGCGLPRHGLLHLAGEGSSYVLA
jgi:hypothetical protein